MVSAIFNLWALFLGLSLIMLGIGLQGTLIGLRATLEGFDITVTGVVMSAFYAGFIAGSWACPRLVRRVGHIRVFAAFASIISVTSLLHALWVEPINWFVLRFIAGMCMASFYIIIESWLNHGSDIKTRGRILAFYSLLSYAFVGLGQLLLNIGDPVDFTLFILISVLMSLSMVPISLTRQDAPPIAEPRYVGLMELFRTSPLGFVGCFSTGIAQSAFFSFAAVYGTLSGYSVSQTAWFVAMPLIGVIFLQMPIGGLSDRFDRRLVLMALTVTVGLIALGNVFVSDLSFLYQVIAISAFGAGAFPLYSLSLAHMNDNLEYDQMLDASSKLVLLFGLGSMIGPTLTGVVVGQFGPLGFFWVLALVHLGLGAFALFRMTRSAPVPLDDQGDFVMLSQRPAPIATGVAMEISEAGSETSSTDEAE